jgi:hypothetical protein
MVRTSPRHNKTPPANPPLLSDDLPSLGSDSRVLPINAVVVGDANLQSPSISSPPGTASSRRSTRLIARTGAIVKNLPTVTQLTPHFDMEHGNIPVPPTLEIEVSGGGGGNSLTIAETVDRLVAIDNTFVSMPTTEEEHQLRTVAVVAPVKVVPQAFVEVNSNIPETTNPALSSSLHQFVIVDMSLMKKMPPDANLEVAYGAPAAASFEFFLDQEKNEKTAWFSVLRPKMKDYPDTPQPDYISTSFGTEGLSNWLVQHQLSQKVRRYFSGIDGNLLHPFLECVGVNVSMWEQYDISFFSLWWAI